MSDRSRRYAVSTLRIKSSPDYFHSVYASVPFKFIVDGEPLYIHADLVSLHSKPLDRLMNGQSVEAQKGVTPKDADKDTFVRFIEWAHKGFYTPAENTAVEIVSPRTSRGQNDEEVVTSTQETFYFSQWNAKATAPEVEYDAPAEALEAGPEPAEDSEWLKPMPSNKKGKKSKQAVDWDFPPQQIKIDTLQRKKKALKEAFINRRYTVRQDVLQIPPPRPNQSPKEDYTEVFLAHARLYVFANEYEIEPLKVLALEELHATLAVYTLHLARTKDIIALLRYVYAKSREGAEDMRTLMTQYVGYEMDTLMDDEDFKHLIIEDGGPLLKDFMTMVARRIS